MVFQKAFVVAVLVVMVVAFQNCGAGFETNGTFSVAAENLDASALDRLAFARTSTSRARMRVPTISRTTYVINSMGSGQPTIYWTDGFGSYCNSCQGGSWTQVAGPEQLSITSEKAGEATLSHPTKVGSYTFAFDPGGQTVSMTVVQGPKITIRGNRDITVPSQTAVVSTTLSASATDDGQVVSYRWLQVRGETIAFNGSDSTPNLQLQNLSVGEYSFWLYVTDNEGWTGFSYADVKITLGAIQVQTQTQVQQETQQQAQAQQPVQYQQQTLILISTAACPSNASGLTAGASVICSCLGSETGILWGTDIYTDDSNVCAAARHSGVITTAGGNVRINRLGAQNSFIGTTRSGLTSLNYAYWGGSFSITAQ